MNRELFRRLERLEARIDTRYEPLVIVADSIPPEYVLAPGERIVIDELQRSALVLVVSERVTGRRDWIKKNPKIGDHVDIDHHDKRD